MMMPKLKSSINGRALLKFTPVCTSEFITFASLESKFEEANCKLIGLSVDGLYSHIAWLRTIKEKIEYRGMKNVEVNFPLIEFQSLHLHHNAHHVFCLSGHVDDIIVIISVKDDFLRRSPQTILPRGPLWKIRIGRVGIALSTIRYNAIPPRTYLKSVIFSTQRATSIFLL